MTVRIFRQVPRDAKEWARWFRDQGLEGGLGNPPADTGYFLTSDTQGNRSWELVSGGGGNWVANYTQNSFLTPEGDGGIVDRSVLQYIRSTDRWEDRTNLDLANSAYLRLRDAAGDFGQVDFADGDFNLTSITAMNFETGAAIEWNDIELLTYESTVPATPVSIGNHSTVLATTYSTTSASFVTVPGLTTTSSELTVGKSYAMIAQVRAGCNNIANMNVRWLNNGALMPLSELSYQSDSNGAPPAAVEAPPFITVISNYTGGDIEFQVQRVSGTTVYVVADSCVLFIELDEMTEGVDWAFNSNTSSADLNTVTNGEVNVNLPAVTIGDGVSNFLLFGYMATTGSNGSTRDLVIGTTDGSVERDLSRVGANPGQIFGSIADYREAPAASTTFNLYGRPADFLQTTHENSAIFALRLDFFSEYTVTKTALTAENTLSGPLFSGSHTATRSIDAGIFTSFVFDTSATAQTNALSTRYSIDGGTDVEWYGEDTYDRHNGAGGTSYVSVPFLPFDSVALTAGQEIVVSAYSEEAEGAGDHSDAFVAIWSWDASPGTTTFIAGDPAHTTRIDGSATTIASTLNVTAATDLDTTLNVDGAATLGSTLAVTGATTLTGALLANGDVDINNADLSIAGATDANEVVISHDDTDLNIVGTNTTDINITGITAIQAGAVDADFDAITATSYGGITEANLLDLSATETVSGAYTFSSAIQANAGVLFGTGGPTITVGTATPEGAVTAPVGSLFLRTDGGASTTLYVKESGTGNTGWVAK